MKVPAIQNVGLHINSKNSSTPNSSAKIAVCVGGDLEGTGWTVPQNLRKTDHASVPTTFREVA